MRVRVRARTGARARARAQVRVRVGLREALDLEAPQLGRHLLLCHRKAGAGVDAQYDCGCLAEDQGQE